MGTYVYKPIEVEAYRIDRVRTICQHAEYEVTLENGETKIVDKGMVARYCPIPGDYYVIQQDGYVYINPKAVFENKFEETVEPNIARKTDFGLAICHLENGKKVAREGWNGKGMYLQYVAAIGWTHLYGKSEIITNAPFIGMKTADNKFVPWLASQTDILAKDWVVVD